MLIASGLCTVLFITAILFVNLQSHQANARSTINDVNNEIQTKGEDNILHKSLHSRVKRMAIAFRLTQSQICQNGKHEYKKLEQLVQKDTVQDHIIKWEIDIFTTVCFIFNYFQLTIFTQCCFNVHLTTSMTFKWMVELMLKQHFVLVRDDLTIIPVCTRRCFDLHTNYGRLITL